VLKLRDYLNTEVTTDRATMVSQRRRDINVEPRDASFFSRLDSDPPREEALIHLELAAKFLNEARQAIEREDVVQACEKLYRVAEECIKAMAKALNLSEAHEARSQGKWTLKLLDTAVTKLAEKLDRRVHDDWSHAYFLHVEGFHEARLTIDQVKARVKYIEELLEIARNTVAKTREAEREH